MRRLIYCVALITATFTGPAVLPVQACPMCKIANEQDARLPRAYMYSILFMMGTMFSLGGGVGVGMYFLGRRENAALAQSEEFGELA